MRANLFVSKYVRYGQHSTPILAALSGQRYLLRLVRFANSLSSLFSIFSHSAHTQSPTRRNSCNLIKLILCAHHTFGTITSHHSDITLTSYLLHNNAPPPVSDISNITCNPHLLAPCGFRPHPLISLISPSSSAYPTPLTTTT
eukprot:GHVN01009448.1.p1 GENE.GHVN01009448.1~~GHVN01009448.1.p1  ORF type:complete len:143 (+),score=21.09 GHVN01009448.1:32-460(+)